MSLTKAFLALGLLYFGWWGLAAIREFRAGYVTVYLPFSSKSLRRERIASPREFWRGTLFRAGVLLFLTAIYSFTLVHAL